MPKQTKSKTDDKSAENLTTLLESDETNDEVQLTSKSLLSISIISSADWDDLNQKISALEGNVSPLTKTSPIFSSILASSPSAYDPDASHASLRADMLMQSLKKLEKSFTHRNLPEIQEGVAHISHLLKSVKSSPDRRDRQFKKVIKKIEAMLDNFISHPELIQMKRETEMNETLLATREKMLYEKMLFDILQTIQTTKTELNKTEKTLRTPHQGWFSNHTKKNELHKIALEIHQSLELLQTQITNASHDSKSLLEQTVLAAPFIQHQVNRLQEDKTSQHFIPLVARLHHNLTNASAMFVESFEQIKKLTYTIVAEASKTEQRRFDKTNLGIHIKNLLKLNNHLEESKINSPSHDANAVELFKNVTHSKSKLTERETGKFEHYNIRNKTPLELLTRMLPDDHYAQFKIRMETSIAALNARLLPIRPENHEALPKNTPKKAWGP